MPSGRTSVRSTDQQGRQDTTPQEYIRRSIGRPLNERVREGDGIRIEWPWAEHGRSRTIITRSGMRRRYVVACFRDGNREAHCESAEERDAAILLDACAGVCFQEQPAKLIFEWRGEQFTHYPDLLVATKSIKEFWECKRDNEAEDLILRHRTKRLTELLEPLGFGYRLVTTKQLQSGNFVENAMRMRRRAKLFIPDAAYRFRDGCKQTLMTAADTFLKAIGERADNLPMIYACLYNGVVTADLLDLISLGMCLGVDAQNKEEPWVWQLFDQTN